MSAPAAAGIQKVVGTDGTPLSADALPPLHTRWVVRRKADLLAAIRGGLISMEDASRRYCLSMDELTSWKTAMDRFGLRGLRAVQRGTIHQPPRE
jgi:hypothetical protein